MRPRRRVLLGAGATVALALLAALIPPFKQADASVYNRALVFLHADADAYTEGQNARFRIRAIPYMNGGSFPDPLTINYRVSQEGDFVASSHLGDKTAMVSPGSNTKNISIPITVDDVSEANGKIKVELLPGSDYRTSGIRKQATVLVRDDDASAVSFGAPGLAVVEGSADTFHAVLNVDPPPYQDITVRVETEEALSGRWSAAEGGDYTAATIDVPVAAGARSATVEFSETTTSGVTIADDDASEDYEHFNLRLRSGSGYKVSGQDWLRVTIIDDESPPPTPEANADGTYTVPADWPLVPEELRDRGGEFRLLFLTNTWSDATSSSIATYDAHVQESVAGSHAGGSHEAIKPYADLFKVVGSTATVDARDHIDAGRDAPVYWMNGPRVALDTRGFWRSSWENWGAQDRRTAASVSAGDRSTRHNWHWTGTNNDGTKNANALGTSGNVRRGRFWAGSGHTGPISYTSASRTNENSLLGISPVFRVKKRPRLEIDTSGMRAGLLGDRGAKQMLVVEEPAACASASNDVSELGGVSHASDLATYRVRLYSDPGGRAPMWVYNPKYAVYRQGSLATGPMETRKEIFRPEHVYSVFYRNGLTLRPSGQPTTYSVSGGPPNETGIFNLYFDSSNWDQWQTISLNIHCADHEDHEAYIVQHKLTLPGDRIRGRDRQHRGITWDYSTWHDVRVKVVDTKSSQRPADLSVETAYTGTLIAQAGDSFSKKCDGRDPGSECRYYFNIHWYWHTPGGLDPRNDLLDATEHFSEFQIKVEGDNSLSPVLPTYVYRKNPARVRDNDGAVNQIPYKAGFRRTGLKTTVGSLANPGDPVYRITITPVTIRYEEVTGEAKTICIQLQSSSVAPASKHSAVVDCSLFTPPPTPPPLLKVGFSPPDTEVLDPPEIDGGGDGGDDDASPHADYQTVVDLLIEARDNPSNALMRGNAAHIRKLNSVLAAIGYTTSVQAMDASQIHSNAAQWPDSPFKAASDYLRSQEQQAQQQQRPEVRVTGGGDITEGDDATFTVTASPAPAADLAVSVTVSTSGDYGAVAGQRTVTVPTTGSATLTVSTTDDDADESGGSVTAAVDAGTDYTVSATQGAATVAVADDDDAAPVGYTVDAAVVAKVQNLAAQTQHGTTHVNRWNRVLVAFGEHDGIGVTGGAMTAAQAQQMANTHSSPVWDEVVAELTALEAAR
ncbi:MAG: hypothetical protein OXT07_12030 [bacterium]|nr:hypothetical protein [bacterium]